MICIVHLGSNIWDIISHGQIFISWSNFWRQIRTNMIQTPLFTVCRKNTVNFCMWNKFWNIKIWLQTESNENEWKAVLSLLRSILHRICNELWMKLLSLTQNPVCVSNIPQENEAIVSIKIHVCHSFSNYMEAKTKQTNSLSKCFKYLKTIWKNLAMFQKSIG